MVAQGFLTSFGQGGKGRWFLCGLEDGELCARSVCLCLNPHGGPPGALVRTQGC